MGLSVWYNSDIRNALLAAEQSNNTAMMACGEDTEQSKFAQGYGAGYRAALVTIALAFGLIQPDGLGQGTEWQQMFLPANKRARL